ncbi:MAG: hypothetical protein PHX08_00715 [Lachnospiraceae bacterium]|nr:hypothetical protein [Lachnospiraceae bacterium]
MSNLFVWKEQLQTIYARQAKYIDKSLQFILGLFVFGFINVNIGYMKTASQPIATVALALICALLPLILMVILAATLILLHLYTLAMPIAIVVGAIFVLMFIFYFRLTPKKAIILLLTPLAFALKVPYVIPIAYGLVGTPIYAIPIACGTMVYYILAYVKTSATTITSSSVDGMIGKITVFAKQIFQNKEMFIIIIAFVLCLLTVYAIHKLSVDHAWTIAIASGAMVNIIAIIAGNSTFDIKTAYGALIFGNILAVVIALVLEFFVFTVDYSRTEHLEFEDDEYYYYVKAIPKISVAAPEKMVKRINERQETAAINVSEVERIAKTPSSQNKGEKSTPVRKSSAIKRADEQKRVTAKSVALNHEKANDALLKKSLREELRR